jgi:UPF0755 protein
MSILTKLILAGFLVLGTWAGHLAYFYFNPLLFGRVQEPKEILVSEGDSFKTVSDLINTNGLVRSSVYFQALAKLTKSDQKIKPGLYALHTAMRPIDILDQMVGGKILQEEVTIREGLTSRKIAKILDQKGIVPAQAFLDAVEDPELLDALEIDAESFEGYLFPATYTFPRKFPPEKIIRQMVGEFKTRFTSEWQEQADEIGMTQQEVVILASIINKEIGVEREAPLVSAVFHNRLKLGMRLQSDPTVIYGIKNFNGDLTRKDLMTHTPYNTYRIDGLPPGPIGNPGEASLRSAIFPAEVDYLYFVSKNNGTHQFSGSLAEHNAAVNQYQRGL